MRRFLARLARSLFPSAMRMYHAGRTVAWGYQPAGDARTPHPWYTYPALEYLSQFDARRFSVFEFGAGSSSLFWAARARIVCAVESDPAWHAKLAARGVANLRLFLREDKARYVGCLAEQKEKFDVIVIDGRWRKSCAAAAPACLGEGGMIVLDNADWHPRTAQALRASGFLQIDFSGFGPINAYTWTTSVFLKPATHLQEGFRDAAPVGGLRQHGNEDE